jgi:pyruvate,water dikinase
MPHCPIKIMMNVGNPTLAFDFAQMPNGGVGLARLEFIINNDIGVHPKAILDYPNVDADLKKARRERGTRPCQPARLLRRQARRGRGHHRRGLLAQAGDRAPVGLQVERVPQADRRQRATSPTRRTRCSASAAPSRYVSADFARRASRWSAEALEARARRHGPDQRRGRWCPSCAPCSEAAARRPTLLGRARPEARRRTACALIMMCEVPSNAILADQFLEYFDGMSDRLATT